MEPLAASAGLSPLLRPAIALQGDLSAVLQEGRVLSGEVLQTFGGGSVLIGVGEHRVPAQSPAHLSTGERLTLRVERSEGELVLRIVPASESSSEPLLLRAMRALLGRETSLPELFRRLVAEPRPPEALARLAQALQAHAYRPDGSAEGLRAALDRSDLVYRAAQLAAVAEGTPAGAAAARARFEESLRARLVESRGAPLDLPAEDARAFAQELSRAVARALRSLEAGVRIPSRLTGAFVRGLALAFERELARALDALPRSQAAGLLRRQLGALPAGGALRGFELLLLDAALHEGEGARSPFARRLGAAALTLEGGDLRSHLLGALLELGEGGAREAVGTALAGIELETLLNLARREFGEALHWTLALPDGAGWTTAHLFLHVHGHPDGRRRDEPEPDRTFRLVVGTSFSRLGPVRAELVVRPETVAVRLRVARPEVARELRAGLDALRAALEDGTRSLVLSVVDASPEEVDVDDLARDIRFLSEHHVMDLEG